MEEIKTSRQAVADLELTCPGSYPEHFPVTGVPRCGHAYLRHSGSGSQEAAVDVELGKFTGGEGDPLALTYTSLQEIDEVVSAHLAARAELALWFADHQSVIKVDAA